MFGMLLFWVLIVAGIVWFARGTSAGSPTGGRRETPLEILDRRFAEGEISVEEYRERRESIIGRVPGS